MSLRTLGIFVLTLCCADFLSAADVAPVDPKSESTIHPIPLNKKNDSAEAAHRNVSFDVIDLTSTSPITRAISRENPTTQPGSLQVATSDEAPEPIVIPIPTSFWTGMLTLSIAAILYRKRKIRFN